MMKSDLPNRCVVRLSYEQFMDKIARGRRFTLGAVMGPKIYFVSDCHQYTLVGETNDHDDTMYTVGLKYDYTSINELANIYVDGPENKRYLMV